MFIKNPSILKNVYKCNKKLGKYIIKKYDILPLGEENDYYIFDSSIENIVSQIPWYVKMFFRQVVKR
jgi:hypothetical protein